MSHDILIVDDEPAICWALEKALSGEGYSVCTASSAEDGMQLAEAESLKLVILDVRLPGIDGISALPQFRTVTNNAPAVVITAFGDLETAVAAVQSGAHDYLTKPFDLDDVLRVCKRALGASTKSNADPGQRTETDSRRLVGQSAAMQHVFKQIALVADSDLPVLITGETGTGKELVADAIVRHSSRRERPYLVIAPVALNPELVESELFGHVRGAFTGAVGDRDGYFERAHGGSLMLDEIGDLSLAVQVKLLRILEQQQFSRVGENRVRRADVRVLAATNSDLDQAVESGGFREDLFHRLSGMRIHLPPLRERTEDIPALCQHFLRQMSRSAHVDEQLSPEVLRELRSRSWLGNVRELRNATEHAAIVARGRAITIDDFPDPQPGRSETGKSRQATPAEAVAEWTRQQLSSSDGGTDLHEQFLATFESEFLRQVLQHTGGNRVRAAELLGLHRSTLRERLRAYESK